MEDLELNIKTLLMEKKNMVEMMEKRLLELEDKYQKTYSDDRTENMRVHIISFRDVLGERKQVVKELEELLKG